MNIRECRSPFPDKETVTFLSYDCKCDVGCQYCPNIIPSLCLVLSTVRNTTTHFISKRWNIIHVNVCRLSKRWSMIHMQTVWIKFWKINIKEWIGVILPFSFYTFYSVFLEKNKRLLNCFLVSVKAYKSCFRVHFSVAKH